MGRGRILPDEYVPQRHSLYFAAVADHCNLPRASVKYFSPRTNLCIIRVAREPHKIAWAGVALMTAVDGRRYVPHVVHVSGTYHLLDCGERERD